MRHTALPFEMCYSELTFTFPPNLHARSPGLHGDMLGQLALRGAASPHDAHVQHQPQQHIAQSDHEVSLKRIISPPSASINNVLSFGSIMPVSKDLSPEHETPPALPPKNYKQRKPSVTPPAIITTPPASPKPQLGDGGLRNSRMTTVSEELNDLQVTADESAAAPTTPATDSNENVSTGGNTFYCHSHQLPNESVAVLDPQTTPISTPTIDMDTQQQQQQPCGADVELAARQAAELDEHEAHHQHGDDEAMVVGEEELELAKQDNQLPNMLEEIDITPYLILKKRDEDGPEVKGGYIDALIVHASRVQKVADNGRHHRSHNRSHNRSLNHYNHLENNSFTLPRVYKKRKHLNPKTTSCVVPLVRAAFSEAFITTFRTFIQPIDVIEKLTHRYTYFFCQVHDQKQKAAKETFSLLVRVVNDLT